MGNWTKSTFCIDSINERVFEGYSQGDNWNGWVCPYFEHSVAEQILLACEKNNYNWTYDLESDAFLVKGKDEPRDCAPEMFTSINIYINNKEFVVYGIGAFSWIWEEAAKRE
jgi:hypothetical protein